MNLLKKLRQRSDERQKMIQQKQTSNLALPEGLGKVNSKHISRDVNSKNGRDIITGTENSFNKENIESLSKLKVLQNVVLTSNKDIFGKDEKRKPCGKNICIYLILNSYIFSSIIQKKIESSKRKKEYHLENASLSRCQMKNISVIQKKQQKCHHSFQI